MVSGQRGSSTAPLLELRGVTKRFGSLVANEDVSLELGRGEILALLGENGAGKSTLMNILFGHYAADSGDILIEGVRLPSGNPRLALAMGVGMVHQHFTLADNLSVLDNIILGTESLWSLKSSRRKAVAKIRAMAQSLNMQIDPTVKVGSLSVGERQRVEIVKALYRGAGILILDEPTSVLTPAEVTDLFGTLRKLSQAGTGIIFISHKLKEVIAVSHRIAVLKSGRLVATREVAAVNTNDLAELMIGPRAPSSIKKSGPRASDTARSCRLAVKNLSTAGKVRRVNFAVAAGEIFGIAGIAGNGQLALCDVLFGLERPTSGSIEVDGRKLSAVPASRVDAGVARIPQDRDHLGVVGDLSVWENAISERRRNPAFVRSGFLRRQGALAFTRKIVADYDIRCRDIRLPARQMSGGNIQKLVLGRSLFGEPGVIVAMQPTWGLDVGAIAYVHQQLIAARDRGAAILLISEDLDELFAMADRIAVMAAGSLSEPSASWSPAEIGLAMTTSAA
jgi:simple sugar transport system ATP-binding protein